MTTIHLPIQTDSTATHRRSDSIGEKAKAAVLLGFCVSVLLWVLAAVVPGDWGETLGARLLIPPIVGLLVFSVVGMYLIWTAAVREWGIEDKDRARAWRLEDEDRARAEAMVAQAEIDVLRNMDHDGRIETVSDEQRIELVAIRLLTRYYMDGQPITREVCEALGICNQGEWNVVNALLKSRGIKKNKTVRDDLDIAGALQLWRVGARENKSWIVPDRPRGEPIPLLPRT